MEIVGVVMAAAPIETSDIETLSVWQAGDAMIHLPEGRRNMQRRGRERGIRLMDASLLLNYALFLAVLPPSFPSFPLLLAILLPVSSLTLLEFGSFFFSASPPSHAVPQAQVLFRQLSCR